MVSFVKFDDLILRNELRNVSKRLSQESHGTETIYMDEHVVKNKIENERSISDL